MSKGDDDWPRLVAFVVTDRVEAGLDTQRKFAEAVGISETSVSNFERGKNKMRRGTLSRVERVLNWMPGSAQVVLNGGEPSYQQPPATRRIEVDPPRDETERAIWGITELPEERRWWHIDNRREDLAKEADEEAARRGRGKNSA